jgi:hypothetical protein
MLPDGYRLAHPHWVHEDMDAGRGLWQPASIDALPPALQAEVAAEIEAISAAYGAERAPILWVKMK